MNTENPLRLLINKLDISTEVEVLPEIDDARLFRALSVYLDHLIQNDFNRLLHILYRIDVSETKVRTELANNPNSPAGEVLASLLIAREKEKIKWRAWYKKRQSLGE